MPLQVIASDFGPLVTQFLFTLAILIAVALVLGIATAGLVSWRYRRKRAWILSPILAIAWFLLIFGSIQLWMSYFSPEARRYRNWKPPVVPMETQVPIPEGPAHDE